ncbi:MAG: EAL domain-containing protein [Erysipelotrichia bacterium]|nr:EAL domain-containing protein [Erysipelotrichia bacterium]NCC54059.1 EAL domain-containing protein [Erysipelotrichia bacterium]
MKQLAMKLKKIKKGILIMSVILVVIISLCLYMSNLGKRIVNHSIDLYLAEISKQTSLNVTLKVSANMDNLYRFKEALPYLESKEYSSYANSIMVGSAFTWIGVVSNVDGNIVDDNGEFNFNGYDVIIDAINGKQGISKQLVSSDKHGQGIFYAIPYDDNEVKKAVVGWVSVNTMKLLLNTDSFEGYGYSHIIANNGDFILHSKNKNAIIDEDNFFSFFENNSLISDSQTIVDIKKDLKKHKNGSFEYDIDGEKRTMLYTYIPECDWYLLTVVINQNYTSEISSFITISIVAVATITIFLLLMITIVAINSLTRKKNKEIEYLAFVDPVSEGYSLARFDLELDKLLHHTPFVPFAFISLDIKNFKLVNDFYGNEDGNKVLKYVYECINNNLKEGEFVSRIAADNFNIVMQEMNPNIINERLQRIAQAINTFNFNKTTPYFLAIVCGTYFVQTKENIFTLRDRSNMTRKNIIANKQHLCSNAFYSDQERISIVNEKEIENVMEQALKNKEFVVYLQPKVNLKNGKIDGAEALVRWQHTKRGLLYPNDFIPIFEKNGFIIALDLYVFEEVCKLLRNWIDTGIQPVRISVNLSRSHLWHSDFLKEYKRIQTQYNIPSNLLEIELTETIVFENLATLKNIISEIHELGFYCSMDDFGSGYSSLNVLKEVSVDSLKLDRIFFNKDNDEKSQKIIQSVIVLAETLGMETVAEGIESMQQVEMLQQMDCDLVQGYVFEKPIPMEAFEHLLVSGKQFIKKQEND